MIVIGVIAKVSRIAQNMSGKRWRIMALMRFREVFHCKPEQEVMVNRSTESDGSNHYSNHLQSESKALYPSRPLHVMGGQKLMFRIESG